MVGGREERSGRGGGEEEELAGGEGVVEVGVERAGVEREEVVEREGVVEGEGEGRAAGVGPEGRDGRDGGTMRSGEGAVTGGVGDSTNRDTISGERTS